MLGDFITRGLLLILGYAYPAFECFKTVEKNKVDIEELRFWCQYWIIVALMTVFERIGDIFISWLPMYGEMKLALIIYLWYPKTKGTGYIYETLLRPYVATHESDIDRNLQELRGRAWDLAICYWQNCTQLGQTTFFQVLEYLAAQTGKIKKSNNEEEGWFTTSQKSKKTENHYPTSAAPPPSPSGSPSFHGSANRHKHPSDQRRPPLPPTPLGTTNRAVAQSPETDVARAHLHSQAEFIQTQREHETDSSSGSGSGSTDESETGVEHRHAARLRLRRSKGFH